MARLAIVLVLTLAATACGDAPSPQPSQVPSASPEPSPAVSATPASSALETPSADPVAAFGADLRKAGATVAELGAFNPIPLGGLGTLVCLEGQKVRIYEYEAQSDRAAAAAGIDAADPSHVGTAIVEWAGNQRFWQRDRVIVLYLGSDPAVEARITAVLGPPFARGQGRDPGPDQAGC